MVDVCTRAGLLLHETFGFDRFRGCQESVIKRLLGGGHALVIMPTGGGKSLCYQVPALILEGLTVVVSPLVALMKDQVDALVARGISATFVNSTLGAIERRQRYAEIGQGEYRLLYVTPERFRKNDFRAVMGRRRVDLLAIDEAHCISQWGHDFRPDYTRLGQIRALLGRPTTIALTATATPAVQDDIVKQLDLRPDEVQVYHEGIERPNLMLDIETVWGDDEKLEYILRVKDELSGSGIVYFALIRTLCSFSERLVDSKAPHLRYHGDLDRIQRKRVQDQFMSGQADLVLATNAFGMGIDKPDIRFVIHAEVPGSMEAYYQEIGRAGRDGLPSRCVLLYDQRDLTTQMQFVHWSNPSADFYQRVHNLLVNESERIRSFGFQWLRQRLHAKDRHDHRLETALAMLERYGVIEGQFDPGRDRIQIDVLSDLPGELTDQTYLDEKLRRNQRKLYSLVEYAAWEGDRNQFIHSYFGIEAK